MQRKGNGAQWSKFSSRRTKKKKKNYSHVDCVSIETQIPISKKKNYVLTRTKYSKKKLCINQNKYSGKKKSSIIRIIRKTHKKIYKKEQKSTKRERERVLIDILWEKYGLHGRNDTKFIQKKIRRRRVEI